MFKATLTKSQLVDFRAFIRATEGKDVPTLDELFELGKLRDIVALSLEGIQKELEPINESLKVLRDAVDSSTEEGKAAAEKVLTDEVARLSSEMNKRMEEETVEIEFSQDSHKFLKERFATIIISKAKSAEIAYGLAKALELK